MYFVLDWEFCSDELDEEGEWIDVYYLLDEEVKVRFFLLFLRIFWFFV